MPRRWAAHHAHCPSYMLGHECNGIFSSKRTAMVLADCIAVMGACGESGSPALQYLIARLAPARRGALIDLGMSLMRIGIAGSLALGTIRVSV